MRMHAFSAAEQSVLTCVSTERSGSSFSPIPFLFLAFLFSAHRDCLFWQWMSMLSEILTFVCSRFSEITLREVLGSRPPRAFRNMDRAEREQLYWALKAQTTAQRGQELLEQQAPPVRFGPNRGQTSQPRRGRRARVLSSEQRRERLAHGQADMDVGGGEVRMHLTQHSLPACLCL